MRLNEAKKYLNSKGYILEDTETNDYEIEELNNDWSEKRKSRASDKELDKNFLEKSRC